MKSDNIRHFVEGVIFKVPKAGLLANGMHMSGDQNTTFSQKCDTIDTFRSINTEYCTLPFFLLPSEPLPRLCISLPWTETLQHQSAISA